MFISQSGSHKPRWDSLMWIIKDCSEVNVLGRGCVNVSNNMARFPTIGIFFCLNKFHVSCLCRIKCHLIPSVDTIIGMSALSSSLYLLLYLIAHIKFSRWTISDHSGTFLNCLFYVYSQFNLTNISCIKVQIMTV